MSTLLQIKTSIFSDDGQSSRLANDFVAAWRSRFPAAEILVRDLAREPVPHLSAQRFQALLAKPEERSADERAVADYADGLMEELQRAEVLVIGLPMYNFGVPSTLKAYFDHIARAGVSFRYTENGPEGLLKGKKAYVFAARGGLYAGTPMDTQTDFVRSFLAFIGIDEVEFVYAEGLATGEDVKSAALQRAAGSIQRLAATAAASAAA